MLCECEYIVQVCLLVYAKRKIGMNVEHLYVRAEWAELLALEDHRMEEADTEHHFLPVAL